MSRARDIIQEIANVRERRRFGSAMAELPLRLLTLEQAFKSHDRKQTELARYFPVALIACMEGYFRMVIRDLIDSGEPYLTNAEKATSNLKPDFAVMRAVHGRKITIGELVSHGIPISRLEHVDGTLSALLGTNFLSKLRLTVDRWAHEVKGEPATPILSNPDQTFTDVSRTFELRHVICHEIASAYLIDFAEIERCFESCVSFLRASDECISETLHPGSPLTQTDINLVAAASLRKAEVKLESLIKTLANHKNIDEETEILKVHSNWKKWCESLTMLRVGDRKNSGTIWSLQYASVKQSIVERWISELEEYRDRNEGEV